MSKAARVDALMRAHGRTFAEDLGIELSTETPSALFRWLIASLLLSARISTDIALAAARALTQQGWTTAAKMAESSWEERTATLNHAGYARYDESTSRMLGDSVAILMEKYDGDLRQLRQAAGRDPGQLRKRIKDFKGIGDVGCDIFCREVQGVWTELYPFADRRALSAAEDLDLGADARDLAPLVAKSDFPRLVAALVRVSLSGTAEDIRQRS